MRDVIDVGSDDGGVMTRSSIPALLNVLTTLAPAALLVPLQWFGWIVCGVLLLAILREQLHRHHARVSNSRACTAENLLRLERAEADRSELPSDREQEGRGAAAK
jgi:hypothetical protein